MRKLSAECLPTHLLLPPPPAPPLPRPAPTTLLASPPRPPARLRYRRNSQLEVEQQQQRPATSAGLASRSEESFLPLADGRAPACLPLCGTL